MADLPPTVEFKTNIPVICTFPWGDFKEGSGQHGPWFKYNVNLGETRHTMFATETLQAELQAIGDLKGRTLTITKVEREGGRKGWDVSFPGQVRGDSGLEEPPPEVQTVQEAPQQPATGPIGTTGTITENQIHRAAWRAFLWAKKCHEDAGFVVDPADAAMADSVRSWAASILIASVDQRTIVREHFPSPEVQAILDNPDPPNASAPDNNLPF